MIRVRRATRADLALWAELQAQQARIAAEIEAAKTAVSGDQGSLFA